ncbi:MAG: CoA-binding protein [Paracoccaceae bacterium]
MEYSVSYLRKLLERAKVVACVGVSTNPVRPSYFVARFLNLRGYRVIPVNPNYAGQQLFGEEILPDLRAIPTDYQVDFVDIFRRSEAVPDIVDVALQVLPALQTIWMQIGVEHAEAAAQAEKAGMDVVQNRCPKIEYQRLFGELRKAGFNTGIISSKL